MFRKPILGLLVCLLAALTINSRAYAFDKKTSLALSHYIMGVVYEDLGDIEKAIEEYKKALKADSENAAIHLNLATSFIKKKEISKAIEELNSAVKLDPEAIEPHAILALLYTSQSNFNLAASEYEMALKNA
ncbi:MAG: tetratricopeptide repeat protein, partial [Candidatus Omnitrophica bacterium]|nr:tetratricopeptide repeat protein [Candidatus Omnitrophota bacterium]